ncbi:hypothetical protein RISK_001279 [Rhodopirellula islandica]|uniref:Uncharacterized protein n=1 Tax=Rhodopirellula islandica TaxID=595434 RepID=A0A0J1BJI4_RHOIS|nr:hypothetical protein RISK_001279 [Rhodopirellula islandica]
MLRRDPLSNDSIQWTLRSASRRATMPCQFQGSESRTLGMTTNLEPSHK